MRVKYVHIALGGRREDKVKTEYKRLTVMMQWMRNKGFPIVLVSAGIELIVFLVAGTVLCFELGMRRMLITLIFSVVAE